MTKRTAARSVNSFSDLPELYAAETATDAFEASFGDPLPLSIIEPGDEPGEHDMPEPIAAQAECGGIVAAIFDLFTDTRLEPLATDIAWGIVNSFYFTAGKLERQEDRLADTLRDMARRMDPGEVFNKELEDKQLECQSLAEQRAAIGAMCDYAAAMYRVYSGRAWTPSKGSKPSYVTSASQISALDFLRARAEKRRLMHDPDGPIVVVSGPADWHDWQMIWDRLSLIWVRIPNMIVLEFAQHSGTDAASRAWCAANGVPCLKAYLTGSGWMLKRAFDRNRMVNNKFLPVEAIICEGSGIQEHLYDLFNGGSERRVPTHYFYRDEQGPATPLPEAKRLAKRRYVQDFDPHDQY
ncbi:DUF2493 domain-containing protein [Sandaracinobacter sp. RS1-74]|uniref:SLOG family protein n=1 Tax=Sandaracinobacteroides sayramensis TaxID=2913411 RepID=UPI001EDB33F4|nr:SLOG family protein [Sandaracinobacteroides sayramensis]MCG2841282.1 DUF2493 domain-containing protein [Sandaracinobacteroides sayramensis]